MIQRSNATRAGTEQRLSSDRHTMHQTCCRGGNRATRSAAARDGCRRQQINAARREPCHGMAPQPPPDATRLPAVADLWPPMSASKRKAEPGAGSGRGDARLLARRGRQSLRESSEQTAQNASVGERRAPVLIGARRSPQRSRTDVVSSRAEAEARGRPKPSWQRMARGARSRNQGKAHRQIQSQR